MFPCCLDPGKIASSAGTKSVIYVPRKLAVSGLDSPYNFGSYRLIQVAGDSLYHPVAGLRMELGGLCAASGDTARRLGDTFRQYEITESSAPVQAVFVRFHALSPCNKRIFTCFDA